MSIMRKPQPKPASTDPAMAFIEAAPDGALSKTARAGEGKGGRIYKQPKTPVNFTAEQDLLDAFDAKAVDMGISRAALLALAMTRIVKGEL